MRGVVSLTRMAIVLIVGWHAIGAFGAAPLEPPPPLIYEDSPPLPKYMTPAEKLLPLPAITREDYRWRTPPTGTIHCPAEYEPNEGLLVSWEAYTSVLTSLIVQLTTHDAEATAFVVVDTSSEQSSVTSTLTSAGAQMDQVEFIVRPTNSVWIRDYGPRFIFEDGQRAMIDHNYNRPRPNDNALTDYLSVLWGEPQYDIPLTHGGGNFHLFADGEAFMSDLILDENPSLTEQEVKDLYSDYQNLDLTIYPRFPSYFDSTGHIDMWMFPLEDDKIVIGEYAPSAGQPYQITEAATVDLTSRGYTVYRTPGWSSGGTHYTYTNGVIINDQLFISKFGGSYTSEDAAVLAIYQAAMPDLRVVQIDCSSIIHAAGAIHCIVMHVPAYAPGDLDGDGDADVDDFARFAPCLAGPGVLTPPVLCGARDFEQADMDHDGDVDASDLQTLFEACTAG